MVAASPGVRCAHSGLYSVVLLGLGIDHFNLEALPGFMINECERICGLGGGIRPPTDIIPKWPAPNAISPISGNSRARARTFVQFSLRPYWRLP